MYGTRKEYSAEGIYCEKPGSLKVYVAFRTLGGREGCDEIYSFGQFRASICSCTWRKIKVMSAETLGKNFRQEVREEWFDEVG